MHYLFKDYKQAKEKFRTINLVNHEPCHDEIWYIKVKQNKSSIKILSQCLFLTNNPRAYNKFPINDV